MVDGDVAVVVDGSVDVQPAAAVDADRALVFKRPAERNLAAVEGVHVAVVGDRADARAEDAAVNRGVAVETQLGSDRLAGFGGQVERRRRLDA